MEDWLSSIAKVDKELSNDVKKNLLVSGGSIVSLLTSQKVNDYDVYIKDKHVLERIARFYCDKTGVEVWPGWEKDRIEKQISEDKGLTIEEIRNSSARQAVAIRNLKDTQVKLYYSDGAGKAFDTNDSEPYSVAYISPNAISLTNELQIVTRFFGDSTEIHQTFDFIHATMYFTFDEGLVTNKAALESVLTKRLVYQGSLYPITSIIRMKKFVSRGWTISAGDILKMAMQASDLDMRNPDVVEEQLIGVDIAYFSALIEAMRTLDTTKLTYQYISELIDRIFSSDSGDTEE
jgi:hypothetical protein